MLHSIKSFFSLGIIIISLLTCSSVAADYVQGQYYCYDQPYYHCVYFPASNDANQLQSNVYNPEPSDASQLQHMWLPFTTPEEQPINPHPNRGLHQLNPQGFENGQ